MSLYNTVTAAAGHFAGRLLRRALLASLMVVFALVALYHFTAAGTIADHGTETHYRCRPRGRAGYGRNAVGHARRSRDARLLNGQKEGASKLARKAYRTLPQLGGALPQLDAAGFAASRCTLMSIPARLSSCARAFRVAHCRCMTASQGVRVWGVRCGARAIDVF